MSFDGKETYVAQLEAGRRSELGDFLYQYKIILEEGILGGVATTAWPLRDVKGRRAKIKYKGMKKLYDTQVHEIEYRPRREDSSVEISLYFDTEDFRHLATQCRVEIPDGPMISTPEIIRASDRTRLTRMSAGSITPFGISTQFLLEERFGDYRISMVYFCPMFVVFG